MRLEIPARDRLQRAFIYLVWEQRLWYMCKKKLLIGLTLVSDIIRFAF